MTQTQGTGHVGGDQVDTAPGGAPNSSKPPSRSALQTFISTLAPLVSAHSEDQERERRLSEPLVAALRTSGFLRLWLPRALGGLEEDAASVAELIEEVSALDGSVGWNFLVGVSHGYFGGYLPEEAAQAIWGPNPDTIIASSFGPGGRAVPVDGGYRVSGRWGYSSGIHQAAWLCGGCVVYEGDRPRVDANGSPGRLLLFFPAAEAEILDTWHTGGLRGTGSHDFTVKDIFVPSSFGFDLMQTTGRTALYRQPFLLNLHGVAFAAVTLGIARHSINAFIDLAAGKVPAGPSRSLLKDRPLAQLQVAQADALVLSARAFLLEATRQAWASTVERGAPTALETGRVRLAIVHAGESALKATEMMHRAGGATAIYSSSPLDRCLRDVHTASQHIQMSPEGYLTSGATLFNQASLGS